MKQLNSVISIIFILFVLVSLFTDLIPNLFLGTVIMIFSIYGLAVVFNNNKKKN